MIVSLSEAKAYIGELGTSYDTFLTQQLQMLSDSVENYCGRVFEQKTWIQTWYREDYDFIPKELPFFHYPISEVEYIREGDTLEGIENETSYSEVTSFRVNKPSGFVTRQQSGSLFTSYAVVQAKYTAGYASAPTPVKQVIYNLIQESYNRKKAGITINFGSDVQSVAIPGVISVQFDYTLDSNDRANTYGAFLGQYLNVLDPWRSERAVVGSGKLEYVDEEVAP